MRDLHHARRHELDAEDELLLLQLAVAQRDLAHLELHALAHQILYARVEGAEAVLGALQQEIDAVEVVDGFFLRPGGEPRKGQREDGEHSGCESHGMLLSQSSTALTLREPARIRKSADGETSSDLGPRPGRGIPLLDER